MFGLIAKIFGARKEEHFPDFEDAVLGKMCFSRGGQWEARVIIADKQIGFVIAGHSRPNSALLSHARDIVEKFADFEREISEFLAREQNELRMIADEISLLKIDEVRLCWPERPDDGMIYFRGPEETRVWRCDYIGRKPQGLGFDD